MVFNLHIIMGSTVTLNLLCKNPEGVKFYKFGEGEESSLVSRFRCCITGVLSLK